MRPVVTLRGLALGALVLALASRATRASEDPTPAPPPARPSTYADHPASWWVEQLARPPGAEVARAVLRWMGAAAVPALTDAALDRNEPVRREVWAILVELARRRADLSAAAAMLGQAVDAPDPEVRRAAAQVLALAAPMDPKGTDGAIALLRSSDTQIRANTLYFLKSRASFDDATIDAVGACLLDPVEFIVESALRTLFEAAPKTARVADVALRARGRVPAGQRRMLLLVLGRVRPVRDDVLDALDAEIRAPGDPGPAVWALTTAARDARPALDRLAQVVLGPPEGVTRDVAAEAFGSLGPAAAPALPTVAALLRDPRSAVRDGVARAVRESKAAAGPVIPEVLASCGPGQPGWGLLDALAPVLAHEIVAALATAPPEGKAAAIAVFDRQPDAVLARVGAALRPVLAAHLSTMTGRPLEAPPTVQAMAHLAVADPALATQVAEDFHAYLKRVPWKNAAGVSNLGGYAISQGIRRNPRAFPVVADAFARAADDDGFPIESRVAFYRMSVGPPATPGQRARLLKDLSHPTPEIANAAGDALQADPDAFPEILDRLSHESADVRLRATRVVMGRTGFGKLAAAEEAGLMARVRDDADARVRATAAAGLLQAWSVTPSEVTLPDGLDRVAFARALSGGLSTEDDAVRALCAWRIRTFAAEARDALPALRRLAEHPEPSMAALARQAIEAIEAATKAK